MKHSRIAIVFQLCFFVMISGVIWVLSPLLMWLLCSSVLGIIWFWFQRQPQIKILAQLDQKVWSIQFQDSKKVHRVHIQGMVQHGLYVVIYFQGRYPKSMLIWQDQVEPLAWKRLKMHVNLQ